MEKLLLDRIVKPDYDAGMLSGDVHVDMLKSTYGDSLADRLVLDAEWEAACEAICSWQERDRPKFASCLEKILARFKRFPTVSKVRACFGEDCAAQYKQAFEAIEDSEISGSFPDERAESPWRRCDCRAAVSAVVDVVAPHIGDEQGMSEAYDALVRDLRAKRLDRDSEETAQRKKMAKSMGIWFPMTKNLDKWREDPRTAHLIAEMEPLMRQVSDRMRRAKSYLQYIPRRRMSSRACADIPNNIRRMRIYLGAFDKKIMQ